MMTADDHHTNALLLLRIIQTGVRAGDDTALAALAAWHEQEAEAKALAAVERAPAIEGLTDGPCYCFPGGTCHACRE